MRHPWILLAVGGAGLLATAAQPWWRIVTGQASPALSGTDSAGGLGQALGALALIGVVLSWTLRRPGRRILAVLLAAVGVVAVLVGVRPTRPSDQAVLDRLRETSLADTWTLERTAWPWVFASCGGLVLAGAVLLALAPAPRTSRYERASVTQAPADTGAVDIGAAGSGAADAGAADPADWWKSLDAGQDPTESGTRFRIDETDARE